MARRIGICGAIGSGKSYAAGVIARERGFGHISADDVVKHMMTSSVTFRFAVAEHMASRGIDPFDGNGAYRVTEMTEHLFGVDQEPDFPNRAAFNQMTAPFIRDRIQSMMSGDCLVEMATLPDFVHVDDLQLDFIVCIRSSALTEALARDGHRKSELTLRIKAFQERRILTYADNPKVKFVNASKPGGFRLTDAELVEMFDKLCLEHYGS